MMPTSSAPWESRLHRAAAIGQWVALTIGIVSDVIATSGASESLGAIAFAGTYVIASTAIPESWFRARFGAEAITLLGALVVLVALTMTGGASSPYMLLSMGPPIFATIYGGLRTGATTGLLSAGLLAIVTLGSGLRIVDAAAAMALYLVFVLLVGVIRKLLEDIHLQAAKFAEQEETTSEQLERLEKIHGALERLSEDVAAGRLNAIEVGAETLDTILEQFPGSAGKLAVNGEDSLVVLAARGIPAEDGHVYELPLSTSDTAVGNLQLTTARPLTPGELTDIAATLHPVTLAFANLRLLQDIVGSAVSEERMRLAREMHDEIGPSLASLGLALDMAAMQQSEHPEIAADLRVLRSNVTKLVEDVRASVADLRSAAGPTLTARILQSTSVLKGNPPIVVDLDERWPPRAALISDLTSIITEATRNAHRHSGGTRIVISGQIDRSFGTCTVVDDGAGFDPLHEPEGHYGLIGIRERVAKIGATIKFDYTVRFDLDKVGWHQGKPNGTVLKGVDDPLGLVRRDLERKDRGVAQILDRSCSALGSWVGGFNNRFRFQVWPYLAASCQDWNTLEHIPGVTDHNSLGIGIGLGRSRLVAGSAGIGKGYAFEVDRYQVKLDRNGDDHIDPIAGLDKSVDTLDIAGADGQCLLARRDLLGERNDVYGDLGPLFCGQDRAGRYRAGSNSGNEDLTQLLFAVDCIRRDNHDAIRALLDDATDGFDER